MIALPVAVAGVGVSGAPTAVIGTLRFRPSVFDGEAALTFPLKWSQPNWLMIRLVAPAGRMTLTVAADVTFWPATRSVVLGGATENSPVGVVAPLMQEYVAVAVRSPGAER